MALKNALGSAISRPADIIPEPFVLNGSQPAFSARCTEDKLYVGDRLIYSTKQYSRECGVSCLLATIFGEAKERPANAKQTLEMLGVERAGFRRFARAAGFSSLPVLDHVGRAAMELGTDALRTAATITASSEHNESTVAATLGSLSKALVLHGDVDGALAATGEWLGVAVSRQARAEAFDAYCSLLKRQGDVIQTLDLSRAAHGHWREANLAGVDVIDRIAKALWMRETASAAAPSAATWCTATCIARGVAHCGTDEDTADESADERSAPFSVATLHARCRPVQLKTILLSDQPRIEGNVLELMLGADGIPSLQELKMNGCPRIVGSLPSSLAHCPKLRVFEARGCSLSGAFMMIAKLYRGDHRLMAC